MKYIYFVVIAIVLIAVASVFMFRSENGESVENPIVVLSTAMGDIKIELFADKTPVTAGNFLKLAQEGFYDGTKFHRVVDGFMIQGGDPNTKGDDTSTYGAGGPDYTIEDEFVNGISNARGTISMANIGQPNTGGSQFFINLVDNVFLDGRHAVFGKVVAEMEVVDAIAGVQTNEFDMPIEPVVVLSVR